MLTGRRPKELGEVARQVGEGTETHVVELSSDTDLARLLAACRDRAIDVLINNAGFGIGKPFLHSRIEEELAMERVHVAAPLRLIHAIAPGMVARGRGLIVNVASLAAFLPLPRSATYTATKAFLRVFTESLAAELWGTGVQTQVLCPGFTRTNFHASLHLPAEQLRNRLILRWMSPERVVRSSLRALKTGAVVWIPGFWNRTIRRLVPLIPRRLYYAAVSGLR